MRAHGGHEEISESVTVAMNPVVDGFAGVCSSNWCSTRSAMCWRREAF